MMNTDEMFPQDLRWRCNNFIVNVPYYTYVLQYFQHLGDQKPGSSSILSHLDGQKTLPKLRIFLKGFVKLCETLLKKSARKD